MFSLVIYFVAEYRSLSLQEGLFIIEELLGKHLSKELVYRGLEICRHCITKKYSLYFSMSVEFKSQLEMAMSDMLLQAGKVDDIYIYEVIALAQKVMKLLNKSPKDKISNVERFVARFVLCNRSQLTDILFELSVKNFVTRKLLKFIWNIMEYGIWTEFFKTDAVSLNLAETVFTNLKDKDLKLVLLRTGNTEFIGHIELDTERESTCPYDVVHVREWTFMCISVVAALHTSAGKRVR